MRITYIAFGALLVAAGVYFGNQFIANDPHALQKQKMRAIHQKLVKDPNLMKEIGELRFGEGRKLPPEVLAEMKQMQRALNREPGAKAPDLKHLRALARKVDRVEKRIEKIVGKPADFHETRFGSVKKTRWTSALRSMENFDKMTNARNLVVELVYPANAFEADIDKNNSFSIAKELAGFECKLLLKALAERCQFSRYDFARLKMEDNETIVLFGIRIKFIQKDGIGKVAADTNLQIKVHKQDIVADNALFYDMTNTQRMAAQRLKTYQHISERCSGLRNRFGNCGVVKIIVGTNIDAMRSDRFYVHSEADFGVLNHAI